MQLKIVSFNMKRTAMSTARNHWSRRAQAIRSFFYAERPDIVGTQELIKPYLDKAQELMPEYGWVGEGRNGGEEGEYTAIFYKKSRFTVLEWGTFWLSRKPEKPGSRAWLAMMPRTCTWAVFQAKEDGSRICVYNTHLDHISMLARLRGLQLIKEHMDANMANCPDIALMGDFNAHPHSHPLKLLRDRAQGADVALVDACQIITTGKGGPGRTYHGFRGKVSGLPIDYIFASSSMDVIHSHIDRKTYGNRYPSDHYPIVTVLRTSTAR